MEINQEIRKELKTFLSTINASSSLLLMNFDDLSIDLNTAQDILNNFQELCTKTNAQIFPMLWDRAVKQKIKNKRD